MAVAADASEFGIKVNNLIVFEPPGFADRSLAEMYKHVLIDEGIKNLPAYTKLAKDERGKESIDSRLDTIKLFTRLAITDIRGNAVSYPKGLGKETGLEDLIRALETQPELKLTIISGGSSAIAPRDNINAAYETLAEDYPGQVGMVRLPGDTHAITTGFARRIGWHVGRILKRKP